MDNTNGNHPPAPDTVSLQHLPRTPAPAPPVEWREAPTVNASGRYAAEETGGLDLAQLLSILRRRWKLMLGTLLACVGLSLFIVWHAKPIYEATATLEMNSNGSPTFDTTALPGLNQFNDSTQERQIDTQLEIIKGPPVRSSAERSLSPIARDHLRDLQFEAQVRGTSNLVDIQARSLDANSAAEYANAIGKAYIDGSLQKNQDKSLGAIRYAEGELDKVKARLAKAQNNLSTFKKQHGVYSLSDAATALTSGLGLKKNALDAAQSQRAGLQAQIANQQTELARIPADKLVPTAIIKNPEVVTVQSQLTAKEIERAGLLQEYTPTSYRVRDVDAEIGSLRAQLGKLAQTQVASLQPDPARLPLVQSIASAQAQLWATDATIGALNDQIARTQTQISALPDQEAQYAQLAGEVELQAASYKQLATSRQNLLISQSSQTPDARLAFVAAPNFNPVAPDKRRILLTGLVMGLLGALALGMLVDALDNRIYTEEDALRATQLPVLAQIPFIKRPDAQSLYLTGERVSPLLESNRMLRANISFCATDKPVKAVVVTSSVPNEGKSTSALNLAVAAALSGESVILLDLDLRRPTQHILTGLPNTGGFTNIIAGQIGIVAALQETPIPNLRVLTSGPTPPNPYKMLNSQTARAVIEKVITMADFVVIDTPPMLGLADARLVSGLVDGTLMVISCQETGRREAARAADLMATANQEVLGTVMTKVPNNAGAYGSYATYERYGRYFDDSQRTAEKMDEAALAGKLDAAPEDKVAR